MHIDQHPIAAKSSANPNPRLSMIHRRFIKQDVEGTDLLVLRKGGPASLATYEEVNLDLESKFVPQDFELCTQLGTFRFGVEARETV